MDRARTTTARRASLAVAAVLASAALATVGAAAWPATATAASVGSQSEPLAGTWSGALTGQASRSGSDRIVIVVNRTERGGSWQLSATCHGVLTLDSISGGYHHYERKLVPGVTCAGGDIDCLKLAGTDLYDAVTSHLGSAYDLSGTLHRIQPR